MDWYSFLSLDWTYPAILKGWIQRVFAHGFAYRITKEGVKGLLKLNQALLIDTARAKKIRLRSSLEAKDTKLEQG